MKNFIFLFVFFFVSCSGNKSTDTEMDNNKNETNPFDTEKTGKTFDEMELYAKCQDYDNNLSSISSSVHFLFIDANPPINASHIDGIELGRDIVMYGIFNIFRYDSAGVYLNHIGNRGQGPREFIQIGGIHADYADRKIYVLDSRRERFLIYSFESVYEKAIPMRYHEHFHGVCFNVVNSNRIVFMQSFADRFSNNVLLSFMDFNGQEIKTLLSNHYPLKRDDVEHFGPDCSFFWKNNEKTYFLEYGNDTIFEIRTDTILPVWHLTGKFKSDFKEHFKKNTGDKLQILTTIQRPQAGVFESDNFLIFKLSSQFEDYYKIYNKTTNKFHRTFHKEVEENRFGLKRMNFFIDDVVSGLKFTPEYQSNGKAIAIITADEICEKRDEILTFIKEHPTQEGIKLEAMIKKMTEDDNGLLMIVKFK